MCLVLACKEDQTYYSILQLYRSMMSGGELVAEIRFDDGYLGYHMVQISEELYCIGLVDLTDNKISQAKSQV